MTSRNLVVRHIDRADSAAIDALAGLGTATIHEAIGRRGFAGPHLRPIQQGASISGSAVTVSCHPGDNLMIHAAVECCQLGDVLVVTNTAPSTHGMFGDLLAGSLLARGVRGLVIDAGVRDVQELNALGFPVWSRAVSAQGTVKETLGSVNVAVVCGGAIVHPGDVIVADDDGAVLIPANLLEEMLVLAPEQERLEAWIMKEVEGGASLPGLYPPNAQNKARYQAESEKSS